MRTDLAILFVVSLLSSPRWCDTTAGTLHAAQGQSTGDSLIPNLSVVSGNTYPTRLAIGPNNEIYVSDAKEDSVFIYDAELTLVGQIKDIKRPLGVAATPNGHLYVGSDALDEVRMYDRDGRLLQTIGTGDIKMPNDLALDRNGWLYVVDSLSKKVWIFDAVGAPVGSIGDSVDDPGRFDFPTAIAIAYRLIDNGEIGELFVADQRQGTIHVFDLQGVAFRAYGGRITLGSKASDWHGKFAKLQSIAFDASNRLHALDCFTNTVQILDAVSGAYIDSYGEFGTAEGQLNLALDVLVHNGRTIVSNAGNHRVEVVYTVP